MGNRYLLRCRCGQSLPVGLAQAGQVVTCSCGALVEVPTMRELATLERIDELPSGARRHRKWGAAGRVLLAGVLVTVLAGCLAGCLWWLRPAPPSPLQIDHEKIRLALEAFSFPGTLEFWHSLPRDLQRDPRLDEHVYRVAMQWYSRWMRVFVIAFGIGLVTIVASLFIPWVQPPSETS